MKKGKDEFTSKKSVAKFASCGRPVRLGQRRRAHSLRRYAPFYAALAGGGAASCVETAESTGDIFGFGYAGLAQQTLASGSRDFQGPIDGSVLLARAENVIRRVFRQALESGSSDASDFNCCCGRDCVPRSIRPCQNVFFAWRRSACKCKGLLLIAFNTCLGIPFGVETDYSHP